MTVGSGPAPIRSCRLPLPTGSWLLNLPELSWQSITEGLIKSSHGSEGWHPETQGLPGWAPSEALR
jgi:hypothetical protein